MPISHVAPWVSDLNRSKEFYATTLKPLGYKVFMEIPDITIGFAAPFSGPDFWIASIGYKKGSDENDGKTAADVKADEKEVKVQPIHVAFTAKSERQVKDWYNACLKAGATCNGPPGPRPQYREGYYAAFVLDPDGHNIEAMYFSCWWVTALSWAPTVLGAAGIAGLSWWFGKTGKGF